MGFVSSNGETAEIVWQGVIVIFRDDSFDCLCCLEQSTICFALGFWISSHFKAAATFHVSVLLNFTFMLFKSQHVIRIMEMLQCIVWLKLKKISVQDAISRFICIDKNVPWNLIIAEVSHYCNVLLIGN